MMSHVSSCAEGEPESTAALTAEQREQLRVHKINEKKLHIAGLGSAIISNPYSNVRLLADSSLIISSAEDTV